VDGELQQADVAAGRLRKKLAADERRLTRIKNQGFIGVHLRLSAAAG
jgi:hypothetical protein